MENSELLLAHIIMAVANIMPALIMKSLATSGNEPNKHIGYRTKASLRSNETWYYAQKRSADLFMWNAIGMISIQIISYLLFQSETSIIITTVAVLVSIIIVLFVVELELRKKFDKEGKPKSSTIIRGD
jgi:hypothetical protein